MSQGREALTAVTTSRGPICCLRTGSGPPVLLLHGIPLWHFTWRHNLDALADHATALAVDLLGFGGSAKPAGDYSVAAHARVMLELLDRLGFDSVDLVGSSYGAAVAITVCALAPERVRRLVVINPVVYPNRRHSAERLLRQAAVAPLLRAALRSRSIRRQFFRLALRRSFARPAQGTGDLAAAYADPWADRAGHESYLATLRQLQEPEVARTANAIRQETLIIWGEQDRILPSRDAARLHDAVPGSIVALLPHCGHLPHEEDPARVNELIVTFLGSGATKRVISARPAARSVEARAC